MDDLDGEKTRGKRGVQNKFDTLDDEMPEKLNPSLGTGKDGEKPVVTEIKLPLKNGAAPAFSIHAQKVYILYPSLFQDPNIFGRFSIPQNINLDSFPEKQTQSQPDYTTKKTPNFVPSQMNPTPHVNSPISNPYNPYAVNNKRRMARQADEVKAPGKNNEEGKKRNVETHMTGTIVVLNQDVNENNQKDAY